MVLSQSKNNSFQDGWTAPHPCTSCSLFESLFPLISKCIYLPCEWICLAKKFQAATTVHSCSLSLSIATNIISPNQDHSSKGKVYLAIIQNPLPDILDSSVTHCFASGADRSFFVVMDAFAITHHTGSPLPSSCFTVVQDPKAMNLAIS